MEILKYFAYAVIIVLCLILYAVYKAYSEMKQQVADENTVVKENSEKLPYRRKYLLTKNEYYFYKSLKEIADKYNYAVLAKVRVADLVEVSAEAEKNEKLKYLAKIKSKHIDFLLCNKENLYPEYLIELNDKSHQKDDRIKRDEFLKNVAEKTGYELMFVYGASEVEEILSKKQIKNKDSSLRSE